MSLNVDMERRPRILVADDESIIAMQIGELLEAEGYALAGVAANAAQAVALAEKLRPDLVLMDIVMPGGPRDQDGLDGPADGIEACTLIQRELNIPVVLLTAHGEEHFLRRARRALPSAYLLKPCQNTQIRAAIEVALAASAMRDPAVPFRLREAHHRIKNSFSLLHSMLRIQEIKAADEGARHALADAGARVLALAKAHEAMGAEGAERKVDARAHVAGLAASLFQAQSPPPPQEPLRLELELDELTLTPAQVIPCGIFLAEAMTNAMRHAFPEGRQKAPGAGVVRVCLRDLGEEAELLIEDDGVGLAGSIADLGRSTFGLQCLQAAVTQLEGRMEAGNTEQGGARFAVRFPLRADYQSLSA